MKETVDFSKLISDALDGSEKAFSELYRHTQKTAYHAASVLLSNPDDIEDVLQNAYSKAFDKLSELKTPESFEGWIKTIVENECKNFIKKERKFSVPLIFFKNKVEENAEEWKQPVPQEYMERQEFRKSVADIIDSLSPEVRACIVLFHYEDKSLNEISEILDIPLGTVKSRLHNGRRQIEKEFNKLRKKDPTLFSIGAIPVIISLLSYQAKNITVPAGLAESVLSSAIGSAASSAGAVSGAAAASGTAGASSAAAGASSVAASLAVKVTAVAVAGSVAVGGSVAIKNYVESKASNAEATTISAQYEETCTVEELITEIPSVSVSGGELLSVNQTSRITSQAHSVAPTAITSITAPQSRTTTQTQTTTKRQTTTAVNTTARKPTTTKSTTVAKTTAVPTTSPENNYGASGGVITEFRGSDTNVSIPSSIGSETVTAIGAGAFTGNSRIKTVSLPSTVNQIGQEAFADCTSLTSVSLPSSLRHIGIGAFYGCTKLSSVSIPDGAQTIGDEAFAQCTSLKTVTIPSSVTSISADAFDGCESLTVRCEEGSFAHSFALENGLDYNLI